MGTAHATCCALGEATRGQSAVTALVHAAAESRDCAAVTEVPGLIPGTDLRPSRPLPDTLDPDHLSLPRALGRVLGRGDYPFAAVLPAPHAGSF